VIATCTRFAAPSLAITLDTCALTVGYPEHCQNYKPRTTYLVTLVLSGLVSYRGDPMKFGVLGPLQVIAGDSGGPSAVLTARLRALLAVLLWRAGQPVPADELAELVWDGVSPSRTPGATRVLIMRLRRQLDGRAAARIVTRAPGYVIEISGDELDAAQFETLTREAGAAVRAGQWAQAARTASKALGLWRGTPLADIPSQLLRDRWVPHLEELHVQALEWRIEADLHEGRHEQLIPELRDLTARHPLREHIHGQLMLALYRCGRQAEALAAYAGARDVLVTELGVEPGPGLQDLHQRILSADPALAVTERSRPATAEPQRITPRELPPTVPGFTGRSAELAALTGLLHRPGMQAPGAVVISAIGGTAGVGKTNPEADTSDCYRGVRNARRSRNRYRPIRPGQSINSPGRWTGHRGSSRRIPCPSSRATQEVLGQPAPYVLGTVPGLPSLPRAC
jgi:DNA-binding SARP family transcriptional activator